MRGTLGVPLKGYYKGMLNPFWAVHRIWVLIVEGVILSSGHVIFCIVPNSLEQLLHHGLTTARHQLFTLAHQALKSATAYMRTPCYMLALNVTSALCPLQVT